VIQGTETQRPPLVRPEPVRIGTVAGGLQQGGVALGVGFAVMLRQRQAGEPVAARRRQPQQRDLHPAQAVVAVIFAAFQFGIDRLADAQHQRRRPVAAVGACSGAQPVVIVPCRATMKCHFSCRPRVHLPRIAEIRLVGLLQPGIPVRLRRLPPQAEGTERIRAVGVQYRCRQQPHIAGEKFVLRRLIQQRQRFGQGARQGMPPAREGDALLGVRRCGRLRLGRVPVAMLRVRHRDQGRLFGDRAVSKAQRGVQALERTRAGAEITQPVGLILQRLAADIGQIGIDKQRCRQLVQAGPLQAAAGLRQCAEQRAEQRADRQRQAQCLFCIAAGKSKTRLRAGGAEIFVVAGQILQIAGMAAGQADFLAGDRAAAGFGADGQRQPFNAAHRLTGAQPWKYLRHRQLLPYAAKHAHAVRQPLHLVHRQPVMRAAGIETYPGAGGWGLVWRQMQQQRADAVIVCPLQGGTHPPAERMRAAEWRQHAAFRSDIRAIGVHGRVTRIMAHIAIHPGAAMDGQRQQHGRRKIGKGDAAGDTHIAASGICHRCQHGDVMGVITQAQHVAGLRRIQQARRQPQHLFAIPRIEQRQGLAPQRAGQPQAVAGAAPGGGAHECRCQRVHLAFAVVTCLQQAGHRIVVVTCAGAGNPDHPAAPPAVGKKLRQCRAEQRMLHPVQLTIPRQRHIGAENRAELGHALHRHRPVNRPARRKADQHRHIHAWQRVVDGGRRDFEADAGQWAGGSGVHECLDNHTFARSGQRYSSPFKGEAGRGMGATIR